MDLSNTVMRKVLKRHTNVWDSIVLVLMLMFAFAFVSFGVTACQYFGSLPSPQDIANQFIKMTPQQKANFFMKSWTAQHADYERLKAVPEPTPELSKILKYKYTLLEKSRVPVRTYATIVAGNGVPPKELEEEIVALLSALESYAVSLKFYPNQ